MTMTASVIIERPIEKVFELTNDHVTEWSNIVEEEHMLEVTPKGAGSTFRTVTSEHGRRMTFEGVVTTYTPPTASGIEMEGDAFSLTADYDFEEVPSGTRVTQRSTVRGKGIFKIILPVVGLFMRKSNCKELQNELDRLKAFCESTLDTSEC